MILSLVILSIACSILLIGFIYREISSLKAVTLGMTEFFFLYVFVSSGLFWLDSYSILKAISLTTVINLFAVLFCILKKRKIKFTFLRKEWLVLGLMIIFVLPVTFEKFEFFGMGQDQGVYQTKAIELINDQNFRIYDFEEVNLLETSDQQTSFYTAVQRLAGFDLVDKRKPTLDSIEGISAAAGIYHGIPTWASILALFGEMFGIAHMQECQTIFLLLLLLIVFYILENLNVKTIIEIPSLFILGFSPQILWVSKSALTEMFLAVILSSFILLILEKNRKMNFFSFVPILIFSLYHVTVFTMMPMFLLIYWGLYLIKKDKLYVYSCNIAVLSYIIGFFFMCYVSPTYTTNNYVRSLNAILPFLNDKRLLYLVIMAVALALLITNILPYLEKNSRIRNMGRWLYERRAILLKISIVGLLSLFGIMCIKNGVSISELGNCTLISYINASGWLLVPVIILLLFISKKRLIGINAYVLTTAFVYMVIFYSIVLRFNIPYYYYYGRYIVPFVFIIIVAFAFLVSKIEKYQVLLLCFLGGISFVKTDALLVSELDDTRMSWEMVESVLEFVDQENTATIVSGDLQRTLFLPISSTSSNVYNEWEDIEMQMDFLDDSYENIYYITTDTSDMNYSLIYRDENVIYEYSQGNLQEFSKYPQEVGKEKKQVSLYKSHNVDMEYDITTEDFEGDGFGPIENACFAWTNQKNVEIVTYLEKEDYCGIITQGPGIPFGNLGYTDYSIDVYFNEEYVDTITIDSSNNGKELYFYIPKELITQKRNIVRFESELWSPSDYGENDSRKIGFAFSKLNFAKIETKLNYEVSDESFETVGLGDVEGSGFAWTNQEEASVTCFLEKKDYEVKVTQGVKIPLNELGLDEYKIEVYINDEYCSTIVIDENNNGGEVCFDISKELLQSGINTISFKSNLWSPTDYGSTDSRQLGFGISTINFIENDEIN